MKKRVLSMFMVLALCLTLLPAPVRAAEDTPESGAIVQQERQEEISPAVSEQAGTNEEENGSEGDPQNTGTPDAGGAEDSKADAPESGEDENAGNNADAAVSAVQTMIDALPIVSELDGMTADELDAAYDDIQAAYDAYEALNAEQQAQITGADFEALLGWFNSQTALLADAQSGEHTHCVCGKDSGTTVNGHTHNNSTAWTAADSLPNSAGSYYLTRSVSGSWAVPEGEVNLCLNGQTINGKITVGSGATLTLTDCSDSGRVQGEVLVNGGKLELYSGTITGGVQVGKKGADYQTGSSFTMYGGAITGNEDYGGVFLVGTTNHIDPPSFTMHGGTISDNTAGASDGGGGGVYVGEKCSFTMDGGTITGNTATAGNGGGIYIHFNAGNVSISNATITGNKASATGDTRYGHGGGIYSERGVTVKNVTITGNNSTFEGGGIYGKGAITLTDATVTDNNQYDVYYDGTESTNPKLTVSGSVKAGYYANYDWKLPILVSGALSEDSVIRVGVREGINPGAIAEPASGVTLSAENFKADAADSVTSLGNDGKVYLVPCTHEMDDTGYTCKKCKTQFDARVGDSAYYKTLTDAFNAARGSTVTLLRNVTLTGNCSSENYSATLDLNGKTVSTENKYIHVGGGNKSNTLTVKDSSKGGGTQALNVKFSVGSNGTLAVDDSYTGEISRVELQAGGALERFGGKIGELVLSNAAYGSTSTGYGLKLWKGNPNACTIGKITDNTKSKSLTVNDLLGTDYAKCELYGEKDSVWSIVPKTEKISELTGYTAYKVQFTECVHQCADDSNPVCSVCHKDLYTKITAKAADGTTKTAYFTKDSALENGYVEAIQTLNGWSNEGCTEPTLTLLRDMPYGTSITLTGTLTLESGTHTAKNVTVAENANVTFASGSYKGATINGTATVEAGVTFTDASVTVNGTLNAKGGTFTGNVKFNGSSIANISGGSYGEITSDAGYVKPYALLAKGYAYKKTKDNQWLPNANSIPSEVTVEKAPFAVEKIYPNSDTNYTGNSAFATDGNITLTAVIAPKTEGVTYYYWWELFDESKKDWTTRFSSVNTATHTGGQSKTLTISGLPVDKSYQYHIFVQCSNGYQCYSEPFTVTQHQHSWTYTASGATIAAKCTAEGCFLTDGNGGSVTINAPAAGTLTYNGNQKAATVTSSDWKGVAIDKIAVAYAQNGKTLPSAPTDAGEYTASITVGEGNKAATASVKYTIQKADPVVTEWPKLSAPVYVNSEATLTGGSGEGTFDFKAGAAKSWDSAGSKTTMIVFTPTDTNNYKELTQDYTVTVVKRTVKNCNTLTGITDKPYGTALEELGLPETVTITTEDGKTFDKIPVTWSGYNPNTLEEQTLTGTLDLTSIANEVEQPGMPVTAQIKVKLTTKSFSGISAAAYEGVYDGSPHGITLTGVPSGATVKYGTSADSCTQDSLTYTNFTNGAKTVYYKVSQSGYADASGSATVNITKRPLTVSSITENKTYAYASGSDGKAIGVNIAGKLPTDRGTTAYAVAKTDTEKLLSEVTVDTAGNLTYKVNQVDASKVGKTAIITVTASMENYENVEYTLTISITDKKTVEIKRGNTVSVDGSNALTYGEKVSKLTLGNTVFVEAGTDDMIKGILSWSNPDEIPAAGTTQAGWVFKPADSTHYAELTGTTAITVAKATPIVVTVPTVAERGYNPDAALTSSDITGGSVTGVDGNSLAGTWSFTGTNIIPTVNNKGYQAVFTPDDTNNYNTVTRTITVTVNKAAKAPNMPEAAMTPAHSTKKVGNITLQEGWSWQEADKDTVLADGVAVTATAVYIGADKGNYETESVSITITRRECDHTHTEIRNQREATCTQTGYAGDTYCTDCDKLMSTGKELAALGHDYKATVTKQPTTTEEGVRTYTCTRCGHSYTESIAKLTSPSPQPTATPSGKPETPSPQPKGTNLKDDTGAAYKVTSANGKTPAVQYLAPKSGTKGTVTVPSEVTIDGVTYKVTSIAGNAFKGTKKIKKIVIGSNITSIGKNAFAGCTSLTSITIGKNVTKIGKNAFTGCKKLKSITIKTKKLTTKTVKKGAFNGISKKVVVKVPKSKYKTYKKLLPAKGLKKAAKIKK